MCSKSVHFCITCRRGWDTGQEMLAIKISCFSDFKVSFLLLHNVSLTISQLINKLLKKYLAVWVLSVVGGGPLSLLSVSHTLIMHTLNYTETLIGVCIGVLFENFILTLLLSPLVFFLPSVLIYLYIWTDFLYVKSTTTCTALGPT